MGKGREGGTPTMVHSPLWPPTSCPHLPPIRSPREPKNKKLLAGLSGPDSIALINNLLGGIIRQSGNQVHGHAVPGWESMTLDTVLPLFITAPGDPSGRSLVPVSDLQDKDTSPSTAPVSDATTAPSAAAEPAAEPVPKPASPADLEPSAATDVVPGTNLIKFVPGSPDKSPGDQAKAEVKAKAKAALEAEAAFHTALEADEADGGAMLDLCSDLDDMPPPPGPPQLMHTVSTLAKAAIESITDAMESDGEGFDPGWIKHEVRDRLSEAQED